VNRHHTGSGRRSVFPDDWQSAHAGVVAATFASTISIGDPNTPAAKTFDDSTGLTGITPGAAVYTGSASIAMVSDPRVLEVVDQPEGTSLYQVELPFEVGNIKHGYVVRVTASPDPALVGADLVVDGSQLGDRRFSRFLHAILHD
jgi:hypothetical protein